MLADDERSNWDQLHEKFKERFSDSDVMCWQKASKLRGRDQGPHESVDSFATAVQKIAKSAAVNDKMLRYAIIRGLRKELRTHVIQSGATSLADLISAARVAEIAAAERSSPMTSSDGLLGQLLQEMSASRRVSEQNAAELRRLTSRLASSTTVNTVDAASVPSRSNSPHRVTFRQTFRDDNMYTRQRTSPPDQQQGIRVGLDQYWYRVSADTCEYRWVSVSADTYFSIGADTSSSFTYLNSQHCCMHALVSSL